MEEKNKEKFSEKVIEIVKKIPRGGMMTYKQVAAFAGSPKAYRAVGGILAKNKNPMVPCHRVVRSDGKIGGYRDGKEEKKSLLEKEGAI